MSIKMLLEGGAGGRNAQVTVGGTTYYMPNRKQCQQPLPRSPILLALIQPGDYELASGLTGGNQTGDNN